MWFVAPAISSPALFVLNILGLNFSCAFTESKVLYYIFVRLFKFIKYFSIFIKDIKKQQKKAKPPFLLLIIILYKVLYPSSTIKSDESP